MKKIQRFLRGTALLAVLSLLVSATAFAAELILAAKSASSESGATNGIVPVSEGDPITASSWASRASAASSTRLLSGVTFGMSMPVSMIVVQTRI